MKNYKDIYELPLKPANRGSWVYDQKGNFVFQFEPKFDEKGSFEKGWKDFEQVVINCINGDSKIDMPHATFIHRSGEILIQYNNPDQPESHVMTIRGWGNLTGIGGHNLPAEEAANIQDTFAEFLVNKLNER